jgi:O-antigen ligase
VAIAIAALALYAAWSYLSISWAAQKGDAWDGANRTAFYLLVFALFAAWRPRARAAAVLLGLYVVGVATIGLVELLRASSAARPHGFFLEGRFASPSGYQNADVALWFSAFWPAVTLGARRETPVPARALMIAAAALLAGLAILGQSRGWLFVAPPALVVFVAIVPRRVRVTLALLLVAATVGAITPTLLHVYQRAGEPGYESAVSAAAAALVAAAAIAGVLAAAWAVVDRRLRPSPAQGRRAGIALAFVVAAAAVAGAGVFVAAEGSPFHAVSKAWHNFKTRPSPRGGGSRFGQSLGSNRYDFWRVAWNRFEHAPLAGIGSDNFQEAYLARRHSDEEPKYPHSVELRTLSQTGLVGGALLCAALAAALVAAARAIRRRSSSPALTNRARSARRSASVCSS